MARLFIIGLFFILFTFAYTQEEEWLSREVEGYQISLNEFRKLAPLKKEELIQNLILILEEKTENNRFAILKILGKLGPEAKAAIPSLIEIFKERDQKINSWVRMVLIDIGPKYVVPAIIEALKIENVQLRKQCARTLSYFRKDAKSAIPALLEIFKDRHRDVGFWATKALSEISEEVDEVIPLLISSLKHEDIFVRINALLCLRLIGNRAALAVPAILQILNHDEIEDVRQRAILALQRLPFEPKQVVPALILALEDDWSLLREGAVLLLGSIKGEENIIIPALTKTLKDEDELVREQAALVLGVLGKKAKMAIPELKKLLKDEDREVQKAARIALEKIQYCEHLFDPSTQTLSQLKEALKDPNSIIRIQAAKQLGLMGEKAKELVPNLISAYKDENEEVRKAVVQALYQITGEEIE